MSEQPQAARAALLLRDALDLDTAQRGAFLDAECAGDAELRAEVDGLLDRLITHVNVLDEPALALAGRLIEGESDARARDTIGCAGCCACGATRRVGRARARHHRRFSHHCRARRGWHGMRLSR